MTRRLVRSFVLMGVLAMGAVGVPTSAQDFCLRDCQANCRTTDWQCKTACGGQLPCWDRCDAQTHQCLGRCFTTCP